MVNISDFSKNSRLQDINLLSCDRYIAHPWCKPDSPRPVIPFDIALIKLDRCLDNTQTEFRIGMVKPCPSFMKHQDGLAIGLGKVRSNSDADADVLVGMKLYRFLQCNFDLKNTECISMEINTFVSAAGSQIVKSGHAIVTLKVQL